MSLFDLDKPSPENAAMKPYWDKVTAIIGGQDAIKAEAETFLPRIPDEDDTSYAFRLKVARFTNIYGDIIGMLASKPFEEEIKLVKGGDKEIPKDILSFVENVDGQGNNITIFSGQLFFSGINDAIAWIFVDYPDSDPSVIRTAEDAKKAKLRPFWSMVLAQNVLEVRATRAGADLVISYIRVLEPATSGKPVKVRILERDETTGVIGWALYIKNDKNEWIVEKEGVITLSVIPFIPFITGRRDGKKFVFMPALQATVDLQITLYQQESDLEFTKKMSAFPMLSASGVTPERGADRKIVPVRVGPSQVLYAPPDGKGQSGEWKYVEPGAAILTFLAADVKETKQEMRELGKQPLTAQAGLTVITTAYAAGKARSVVGAWGLALKDALENAMLLTCEWLKIPVTTYDPEINVYDEYDTFLEGDFQAVLDMRNSPDRDISRETLWNEAKRRGILSAEFDDEKEHAALLGEAPRPEEIPDPLATDDPKQKPSFGKKKTDAKV